MAIPLNYPHFARTILCALTALAATTTHATTNQTIVSHFQRLESNDPNYFVIAAPLGNANLNDDELHTEFNLSIKYPFTLPENTRSFQPDRLDVIYNGLFDFYLFDSTRYDSGPIISRRQNPGARLLWDLTETSECGFGYFHESNGQTIDQVDGAASYYDEVAQGGEEYALAQMSRGWDYLQFSYQQSGGEKLLWTGLVEYRQFLPKQGGGSSEREDDIFWDPSDDSKIQDYDGLRFMYEHEIPTFKCKGRSAVRLELKTGSSGFESLGHLSAKISYTFCNCMQIFYFNGYGKEPSTYHLRTEYAGFGLVFR